MKMKNSLRKSWHRFQSDPLEFKLYRIGTILCVIAVASLIFVPLTSATSQWIFLVSSLPLAAGFALWGVKITRKTWGNPYGQILAIVLHAAVFTFATIIARQVVASSTRLPPQDFDLAVVIIAAIVYAPVAGVVILICSMVTVVTILAARTIYSPIRTILQSASSRPIFQRSAYDFRATGAVALSVMLALLIDGIINTSSPFFPRIVRAIVYVSDYHVTPGIPGIPSDQAVRLHGDGIYSIARFKEGDVQIEVMTNSK
ncbi:MAG: hypothetical protein QM766_15985 [Burkholderiaceae bacterium]